jgi:hypothetical protein
MPSEERHHGLKLHYPRLDSFVDELFEFAHEVNDRLRPRNSAHLVVVAPTAMGDPTRIVGQSGACILQLKWYPPCDVRDQAVRELLGIPLTRAAKLAGVGKDTLRLYEADPQAVKGDTTRRACERLYAELRELLARAPFRRAA